MILQNNTEHKSTEEKKSESQEKDGYSALKTKAPSAHQPGPRLRSCVVCNKQACRTHYLPGVQRQTSRIITQEFTLAKVPAPNSVEKQAPSSRFSFNRRQVISKMMTNPCIVDDERLGKQRLRDILPKNRMFKSSLAVNNGV